MVSSMFALWLSSCSHYHNGEVSDHYDGKRFFNPGKPMTKGLGAFLKWRFNTERGVWPEFAPLDVNDSPPQRVEGSELRVSFVGHATVLIQTEGLNILTDPMWSNRASLVQWAGPERVHPPGVALEDLPPVDVVLISHNHYDHLDLATLKQLSRNDQLRIIVPLGNKNIVQRAGNDIDVDEFDWGESVQITSDVKITLEPMHHWSARGLFDRNKALWASFVIETPNGNIYFVGDSGYGGGDYYREVLEKYRSFRFAILPMGAYKPRWFMSYSHMDPQEMLLTYNDLGNPFVLPTHHMVFPLADTGYVESANKLNELINDYPGASDKIKLLKPGQKWFVPSPN